MFVALGFLFGLVALSVALLAVETPLLPALLPFLAAGGLALLALRIAPGEGARCGALARPLIVAALVAAAWMLLQMAPLPSALSGIAHPVWASVKPGLTAPVAGSISIDIGATAMALLRFGTLVGATLLAVGVAIDRERAEAVLIALTVAAAVIALGFFVFDAFGALDPATREEALDCACLGVVLAAACAALVLERHETRRAKLGLRDTKFVYPMAAALAAFLICAAAIVASRSGSILFAACCGLGLFCAVFLVRRLNLGRWGAGAIGVTATVIIIALMAGAAGTATDPRLAFVRKGPATLELTQRILADAPVFGVGAGAFEAIVPIYQFGDDAQDRRAVTAAAKVSIEMGRTFLWAALIAAAAGAIALLRYSAQRGRDSFYASAAASCILTLIVLAFINVGLFGAALPMLGAVALGLGIAQTQGRGAAPQA